MTWCKWCGALVGGSASWPYHRRMITGAGIDYLFDHMVSTPITGQLHRRLATRIYWWATARKRRREKECTCGWWKTVPQFRPACPRHG